MDQGQIHVIANETNAQDVAVHQTSQAGKTGDRLILAQAAALPTAAKRIQFDISPQAAASALIEFGRQADVTILVDSNARDIQLPGLKGEYGVEEGLTLLLDDTGLVYRFNHESIFVSRQRSESKTSSTPRKAAGSKANVFATIAAFLASVAGAQNAMGQEAQDPEATDKRSRPALEEVIVTAQKREQSVFDVPMSITALTAADVSEKQITNVLDLSFAVPGLTVQDNGGINRRIFIRGVGNIIGSSSLIGIYLDEMPVSANSNFQHDLRLYDIERVEVLKGPQGTLYGQGSMGGTIRFITKKPQLDNFSFKADAAALFTEEGAPGQTIQSVINVPLIENELGLRVTGAFEQPGGWIDQPAAVQENVNDQDIVHIRAKGLWQPVEALQMDFMALIHRNNAAPVNSEEDRSGNYAQAFNRSTTPMLDDDYEMYNTTLTYDFKNIRFLGTTSYVNADRHLKQFGDTIGGAPFHTLYSTWSIDTNIFSQEVRLSSIGSERLHWTIGAVYSDSQVDQLAFLLFGLPTAVPSLFPAVLDESSKSWAVFGDVSYAFTDRFEVGAGLRYFEDKRELFDGAAIQKGTFDSLSPRVYVNYDVVDNMKLYASVAKGFRSGGFNFSFFGVPAFEPEKVWTYEVGAKVSLNEARIEAEVAVFHSDYKSYQVTGVLPPPAPPFNVTSNAGDATIEGVDVMLRWRATDRLSIEFGGNYIDTEFDEISLVSSAYSVGDRLDLIPTYSYALAARYAFSWLNKPGFFRLDYNQQGRSVFVPQAASSDVNNMLNLHIGWDWSDNLSLGVVAQNLLDDRDLISPGGALGIRARPRTVGIEMGIEFD